MSPPPGAPTRLVFKFGEHGGRRVLLILEVVHNHDYARSRFLHGGDAGEADFEPVGAGPAEVDGSAAGGWRGVEAGRMAYLNPASTVLHVLDKPLSFDDAQAAVFGTPLPLIVIGPAGSGKTALTLEKLKTLPGHGLYLTRSSFLVESGLDPVWWTPNERRIRRGRRRSPTVYRTGSTPVAGVADRLDDDYQAALATRSRKTQYSPKVVGGIINDLRPERDPADRSLETAIEPDNLPQVSLPPFARS